MPQLSMETFVTQYFWLVVLMLVLYYMNVSMMMPSMSLMMKSSEMSTSGTQSSLELTEMESGPEYKSVTYNSSVSGTVWEV